MLVLTSIVSNSVVQGCDPPPQICIFFFYKFPGDVDVDSASSEPHFENHCSRLQEICFLQLYPWVKELTVASIIYFSVSYV